ncbi:alpha-tubulin N-acetyltransferase 1-like isoform X2 [Dreissena polymorpha]|uniref:alpha-tubulin N-acetyltransferase 1-like isoform X2 n=1 Tax=Dreissena polymorpha TaxID=45954 RepID=UPI002264B4D7|nr:alpha-tubulin N-acetyltransferase 1-like isoform X2 [Dreissena polymorpha]
MEFSFNVNHLLSETITKLDCNITPARRNAEGYSHQVLRSQLLEVIDRMGDASSKAQGLYTVITTGRKLQLSDHILFIMKDASGNGGRGTAVGILKIGRKKLFVYSHHGAVHEMEPLCVLDFYVHESRQRMGCGRKLFDFMLQDTGVKPVHLAIDKPSFKFSQFLAKHFNLRAEIPQVNNFVVFEGFFVNRPESTSRRRSGQGRPPLPRRRDNLLDEELPRSKTYSGYNGYGLPPLPPTNQGLGQGSSNQNNGLGSRPPSGSSVKMRSPSVLSTPRRENGEFAKIGQLKPLAIEDIELPNETQSGSLQEIMSSRSQNQSRFRKTNESPIGGAQGSRPNSSNITATNGINGNGEHNRNNNSFFSDGLLLKRGASAHDAGLNLHQEYQGRRGHLRTRPTLEMPIRNPFLSREEEVKSAVANGWKPAADQRSWTVFDNDPTYLSIASRNYTHTRLW